MKNILYIENKRLIKQPLTYILLLLIIGLVVMQADLSTKQYDTKKYSFDELMDQYVINSHEYSLDRVLKEGTKGLSSEVYKDDILRIAGTLSFEGNGDINDKRIEKIKEELKDFALNYDENTINDMVNSLRETKLDLTYSKGWENILNSFSIFTRVLLLFIVIYTINIFAFSNDSELQLYNSTLYGGRSLFYSKTLLALGYGIFFYVAGTAVYLLMYMFKYGLDGSGSFIFSNPSMVLSMYRYTYIGALFKFMIIGVLAITTIVFVIAILSSVTGDFSQLLTAVIVYFSFLILMDQLGKIYLNHFICNFLMFKMSDFMYHLRQYHIYNIFGKNFKGIDLIIIIGVLKNLILFIVWRLKGVYINIK